MRIPIEKKKDDLESWLQQLQKQVSELKPDNEEVQAKLNELQISLDQTIKNQAKQQSQQIQCQKQIALLRSQIEEASDAKNIQPLAEKLKNLEMDLTQLKSIFPATDIPAHLKTLQDEYLNLKKGSEQVVKFNSSLRTQLQSLIEESARQADQFTHWQTEFAEQLAQQNKQQDVALNELQAQLSQTKVALSKRLAALEGRVGDLEVKHTVLEAKHDAFVAKTDPTCTIVQKLLKLRQVVLEDKYISDELKYYVPPNGESQPGLGDHEALYEWTQKNLLDDMAEVRVLLLQGQAGAGKSTFNRFLLRELWQDKAWENFKLGQPVPSAYIPIFIPLTQVDPKNLFSYFLKLPELVEDFMESEINVLKKEYRLLLIADGYDEIPGNLRFNLYNENQLYKYEGRIKLLISCRTSRAQEIDEDTWFVPHNVDKAQYNYYKRRYVAAFNQAQISSYIGNFLAAKKERSDLMVWPDVATYQQHIEQLPDLKKLIDTPFLLSITLEVLPQIVADVRKESKDSKDSLLSLANLTKAKLYDKFMGNWFQRQKEKALQARALPTQGDIIQFYREFCLKFAECLHKANATAVQYPQETRHLFAKTEKATEDPVGLRGSWVEMLFGKNPEVEQARLGCPITTVAGNFHQFIHASLIDYFLTTQILEQSKTGFTPDVRIKATPESLSKPSISEVTPKPEIKEKGLLLVDVAPRSAETLLGVKKLTYEQINFLVDRMLQDEHFGNYLFDLIERSKKEKIYIIAAANAITVLNAAHVDFSGMDLRGIQIQGADLSGAICDNTNFEGADLRDVNFQNAWLRAVNLKHANLSGLRFGEWPCINKIASYPKMSAMEYCKYSPDGRYLTLRAEKIIQLYDAISLRLIKEFKGPKHDVSCIAFDTQSKYLVSGDDGGGIHMWDILTGKELLSLSGHEGEIGNIIFCSKDKCLLSADYKNTIRLWDIEQRKQLSCSTFTGHEGGTSQPMRFMIFDPSGKYLATGGIDGVARLWDAKNGNLLDIFEMGYKYSTYWIVDIAFDLLGKRVVIGRRDGGAYLYEAEPKKFIHVFCVEGRNAEVASVAFHLSGKYLAVGDNQSTLYLWDIEEKLLLRKIRIQDFITMGTVTSKCAVKQIAFDTQGQRLLACTQNKVSIWDITTGEELRKPEEFIHKGDICGIALNAKNNYAVSAGLDKTVRLWDLSTGKQLDCWDAGCDISEVVFGEDDKGREYVAIVATYSIRRFSISTNKFEPLDTITTSACSRLTNTGEYSAAVDYGYPGMKNKSITIIIWKQGVELKKLVLADIIMVSSKNLALVERNKDLYLAVAVRRYRGRSIIEEMLLWNIRTNKEQRFHVDHKSETSPGISSIAFDPRGDLIVWGGSDPSGTSVQVWDAALGKMLWCSQHKDKVTRVIFDETGKFVISASYDKTVRSWNVNDGSNVWELELPYPVIDMVWKQGSSNSILVVAFENALTCFDLVPASKDNATLRWINKSDSILFVSGLNIADAIGLDYSNYQLLQQRGAKGTPAEFKTMESQLEQAGSSPAKKDPTDIHGLAAPATRLGLLAAPSVPPIPISVSVDAKAITEPKTL